MVIRLRWILILFIILILRLSLMVLIRLLLARQLVRVLTTRRVILFVRIVWRHFMFGILRPIRVLFTVLFFLRRELVRLLVLRVPKRRMLRRIKPRVKILILLVLVNILRLVSLLILLFLRSSRFLFLLVTSFVLVRRRVFMVLRSGVLIVLTSPRSKRRPRRVSLRRVRIGPIRRGATLQNRLVFRILWRAFRSVVLVIRLIRRRKVMMRRFGVLSSKNILRRVFVLIRVMFRFVARVLVRRALMGRSTRFIFLIILRRSCFVRLLFRRKITRSPMVRNIVRVLLLFRSFIRAVK